MLLLTCGSKGGPIFMTFTSFSKAENAAPGFPPSRGWKLNERGMENMGRVLPREDSMLVIRWVVFPKAALCTPQQISPRTSRCSGVEGKGCKPRFRIPRSSQAFAIDLVLRAHSASPGVHPGTNLPYTENPQNSTLQASANTSSKHLSFLPSRSL